ncbi:MAG: 4-alpha-glucanotransferase [Bacteroidetes bacterium]|nr:4-alpha-glucanotransferase [Bacteroidota bacterium]
MKFQFFLRFHTEQGQSLWITGAIPELGDLNAAKAIPMNYFNEELWHFELKLRRKEIHHNIEYRYLLKNKDGIVIQEWGKDRLITPPPKELKEIILIDTWNHAGEYENAFYTDAFLNVLFKTNQKGKAQPVRKSDTHIFKVKAPLLKKDEVVCIIGSDEKLGEWSETQVHILKHLDNWWVGAMNLSGCSFPIAYKYGIYNKKQKKFVGYEDGNNRLLFSDASRKKMTILHDGFIQLPNNTWKGTGVAIPVFSLRSKDGFGIGEFSDIKLLSDWAKKTEIKLIQLLPINDTSSSFTQSDSYPYSTISSFALHPVYINLAQVAGKKYKESISYLAKQQKELNLLSTVDYDSVIECKMKALKELYQLMGEDCFKTESYKTFFNEHKNWLLPYSAFCLLRDEYKTTYFQSWEKYNRYQKEEIEQLCSETSAHYKNIRFYYFVQYHLHIQLTDAVDYSHKNGIVIKGDLPIGISTNSCEAWQQPELFNTQWQTGAPPDDFTSIGQNWGFPTYNWPKMQEDDYAWWKHRFSRMSDYFDAYRIDHILGFFRIWSIPEDAVQGNLGRFIPCIPVKVNEFGEKGIWFDYQRFCKPYITDEVLEEIFIKNIPDIIEQYLDENDFNGYDLKEEYATQKKVEAYFSSLEQNEDTDLLKQGLFDLIANVILFEDDQNPGEDFHFRIAMDKTTSFKYLIPHVQNNLKELFNDYFYRRQDDYWFKNAMKKLPQLKAATNMLVCGEDLGMVPHCVPEVMKQLGILSLEVQRMPKNEGLEFIYMDNVPYLSVVTPSTHDMSTIRGWWEENYEKSHRFYNKILEQSGDAPVYCDAWVNRAIVLQHLYSPAMWSIFQLQDILGMSELLRRENAAEERINDPSNSKQYWNFRMHLPLEDLIAQKKFNDELKGYILNAGR